MKRIDFEWVTEKRIQGGAFKMGGFKSDRDVFFRFSDVVGFRATTLFFGGQTFVFFDRKPPHNNNIIIRL